MALALALVLGLTFSYLVTSDITRTVALESRIDRGHQVAALVAGRFAGVPAEGLAMSEALVATREILSHGGGEDQLFLLGDDRAPRLDDAPSRARFQARFSPTDLPLPGPEGHAHRVFEAERDQDPSWLVVTRRLPNLPTRGDGAQATMLVIVSNLDGALARVELLKSILLLFLVVTLGIAIIPGYVLLGRVVVGPLQRLVRSVEGVRAGRFERAEGRPGPSRELGEIYAAFDMMADQLASDHKQIQMQLSELRLANRELEAAQQRLIVSEKLATVGTLAAGVAHEIGNPISVIQGYLEMLDDPDLSQEDRATFLKAMEGSVDRIGTIIRDLLDFARPQDADERECDVVAVARATAQLVEPQPRMRDLRLVLELPEQPVRAAANPVRLEQILLNLIFNAADASEAGGTITLRVVDTPDDPNVVVSVSDEGHGIDPADQLKIFDPFFTTKDPGQGTGLGLAICHSIVENYGGRIVVESASGEGTTMSVILPRLLAAYI